MRKLLYITLLCLGMASQLSAQRGFEVGAWLGAGHYFGDLNTTFNLNRPGFAGGLIGRFNFHDRISLRVGFNYGQLSAYDSDSDNAFELARNLSFKTNSIDGFAAFEFNFLPYIHGSNDHYFTPYLLGGFGVHYYNPKAKIDDQWVRLQPLGTEGQSIGGEYNLASPMFVYGFGVKFDINYLWSINVELTGRALFTDYIDDVSTVYPNIVELQALRGDLAARLSDRSGEIRPEGIGEPGRQRGTSSNNDGYAFLSVGIVYYIGQLMCPTISRPDAK